MDGSRGAAGKEWRGRVHAVGRRADTRRAAERHHEGHNPVLALAASRGAHVPHTRLGCGLRRGYGVRNGGGTGLEAARAKGRLTLQRRCVLRGHSIVRLHWVPKCMRGGSSAHRLGLVRASCRRDISFTALCRAELHARALSNSGHCVRTQQNEPSNVSCTCSRVSDRVAERKLYKRTQQTSVQTTVPRLGADEGGKGGFGEGESPPPREVGIVAV
eukprot:680437-Prymnesium_polylepis.2